MNERWWRIGDGINSQRYYQIFFECMRKEVGIGGGDIKKGECILGGRRIFIGCREVRRVGDEDSEIKWSALGFIDVFGKEMGKIQVGKVGRVGEENIV